jgi:hypothetical protein
MRLQVDTAGQPRTSILPRRCSRTHVCSRELRAAQSSRSTHNLCTRPILKASGTIDQQDVAAGQTRWEAAGNPTCPHQPRSCHSVPHFMHKPLSKAWHKGSSLKLGQLQRSLTCQPGLSSGLPSEVRLSLLALSTGGRCRARVPLGRSLGGNRIQCVLARPGSPGM